MSRADWRAYVQSLQVERQLPGIQGVGYALLIPPERLAQHELEIRQEGFPKYRVWPEGPRAVYSSIIYLEPFTNRNLWAFGYDMLLEPTRRAALERARDANTAALTGKVKLVQETSTDVQAGTLMYVPVYRKGMPVATVAERRAALQGWVYSPCRMNDLMAGLLGRWVSLDEKRIRLQVFDGQKAYKQEEKGYEDFLLYDSQPGRSSAVEFTLQRPITCAGRPWTLLFTQSATPASAGAYWGVWEVAGAGAALSLLLARFTAQRLASRLTADLQHTTERLELATEAGGVGIWDYDVASNRLVWDEQMFRLYGTSRAQFGGAYEAWTAGVHPEDRQRGDEEIQQALRGEKEFNTEFQVRWADGSVRHIRAMAQVQRDASGRPLRMLGTNWDITDRKKAEEALQESEEHIVTLLNSTAEAIYGIDVDGNCTFCNKSCLELLGYERPEELLGKNMHWQIHGKHADGTCFPVEECRIFKAFIKGESSHVDDEVLWRADGTVFPAEYWSYPQRRNGVVVGAVVTFLDITERKRVEDALHESQLFLEETQRIARLAGWKANPRTDYLELAGGVYEILEVPPGKQPGLAEGLKFFLPEYIPTLRDSITRCLDTGERFAVECQGTTGTGKRIWTEVRGLAPMVKGGRAYVMGMFQDITARKQAEAALRESETNFRTFFESMTDLIFVGTPAGRILFTNAAVIRTLGYRAEELATMQILEAHPEDRRKEAAEIFGAMLRGEQNRCPLPLACKDGSLVPVETRIWLGQWNGAECIFGIAKNLSIEVEAQQRFERLFRSNPALLALSTLPERRFFDVNDAFLRTLGYSRSEVLGRTSTELGLFVYPEQQGLAAEQLEKEGRVSDFEMQVRRKDGALLAGHFSGEVIISQGRQFLLTVMIDITERKRAEGELLRTLAAERELSALKSTFVSMVSHEFRTPLGAILGAAEMLEDYYDRLSAEKRANYFQMIRQEIRRLTGMLQDVLLQGQLDAGRVQFKPRPAEVVGLCREVLARVQGAFPKHPPIHFEADAPAVRALVDESLLERVLSNLLINGLKYSPALTPVRFSVRRAGAEWEFKVQDQGIGIPAADQAVLFSAFRRGGNVGAIKGSGVGLYIVKKCAELHGGRVELQSQVGQGSTFSLYIPWQPAEPGEGALS
ncbi:MAG: PAS domain S-box protein [Verrucomicrobia bacterium]|nr:PAS domain S-box protein [Verrucomicrobiota bacterium]